MVIFITWIAYILLEQKINQYLMKRYVKINIFVELQCHQKRLIKKTDGCANNPENISTAKIGEHIP